MLGHDFESMGDTVLNGACLRMMTREVCDEYWPISVKWNKNKSATKKPEPVAAVMGACYAMRREWYFKIGEPLKILEEWGQDEEILSLACHLMGGQVILMPQVCGHIYAAPHLGRVESADRNDLRWSNRRVVVLALPATDAERKKLLDWMNQTRRIMGDYFKLTDDRIERISGLREHFLRGKLKWRDLIERGIVTQPTEVEQKSYLASSPPAADGRISAPPRTVLSGKTQIVIRDVEVCDRCGARDSFVQTAGRRNTMSFDLAYARCKKCGHKAQIRTKTQKPQ